MCILPYIVLSVVTKALCTEESLHPDLLNLIKFMVNSKGRETEKPNKKSMFFDLTRKETDKEDEPLFSSELEPPVGHNRRTRKILIKRFIPHKIQLGPDVPVLYRPLLKIHNVKVGNYIPEPEVIQNLKHKKYSGSKITKYKSNNYNSEKSLKIFEIVKKADVRDIFKPKYNSKNKMITDDNIFRSEDYHGVETADIAVKVTETTEEPSQGIANYPPWNYMTYWKSIYQDSCPGQQVKVGNMCIKTPPH